MAILDLDRFKEVNDLHGHAVGDEMLKAAASAFASVKREEDILARIGGEEFLVLLPSCQSRDGAVQAAERMREAVERITVPASGRPQSRDRRGVEQMQGMLNALRLAVFAIVAAVAAPAFAQEVAPGSVEREVRSRLDAMRAVTAADVPRIDEINKQMDDTWKYFDANRAKALPILRSEVAAEVRKPDHSQFMLLVVGFYLYTNGTAADREPAKVALFAVDPAAPIVRANLAQYFYFVHAVASEHDERVLPLIDSVFLDKKVPLVIPEYALNLDPSLVCMLLYGAYGDGAEEHLQPFLQNPGRVRKVLEILIWIGSPSSNAAVVGAIRANRDLEVFARATTFLMQSGGPEGRDILLKLDPAGLDPQSADALTKSRSHVQAVSGTWYKGLLDRFPGVATIPDAELRKKIAATVKGTGGDQGLSPKAIYASNIPRDELIFGLTAARNTMLKHLYDQVLQDVRTTDTVINGLRFRDH